VVLRVAFILHSELLHDPRGGSVLTLRNCDNSFQATPVETIFHCSSRRFRRNPFSPMLRGQPPANLDSREIIQRLKPAKPCELRLAFHEQLPETIAQIGKMEPLALGELNDFPVWPRNTT